MRLDPAPSTLIIAPFSSEFITSLRRTFLLPALSSKNRRSFLERRTYPKLQNVERQPVMTPKSVKYKADWVDCWLEKAMEKSVTMAATVVRLNWYQKLNQPNRRQRK